MRIFRKIAGFLIAVPFYCAIKLSSIVIGRDRAIIIWGPIASFIITAVAEFILIPKIKSPNDFDVFIHKIKRNANYLRALYDITIQYQDKDKIILNYHNCPHCEAFASLGLWEIGPYICKGDWVIADKYNSLWNFERTHQISTGDSFCDHTYIRKYT